MKKYLWLAVGIWVSGAWMAGAGWVYEAVTRGEGGREASSQMMKIKAEVDGEKARIEIVESGNPMMIAGDYIVTSNAGQAAFLVRPLKKTFSRFDAASMAGMAGGMMKMMNMKVLDPKTEVLADEDGPKILGYATRYYKVRTSYSTEMSMMGMKMKSITLDESETWSAPKLTDAAFRYRNDQAVTGIEELDKLTKARMEKIKGFPLKQITSVKTTDQNGKTEEKKTTLEVLSLKESKVGADSFVLPAGFTEQDLFSSMMGGVGGGSGTEKGGENPFEKLKQLQNERAPHK